MVSASSTVVPKMARPRGVVNSTISRTRNPTCSRATRSTSTVARAVMPRILSAGSPYRRQVIGDRWGVTDDETTRRYPCDDLVPFPSRELWRGVTVAAPPSAVWPWLCQLRLAPYSYDWVDNLG